MTKLRRFRAEAVAALELPDRDPDTFVVVLAEMPDGDGARLELQLALTFDVQDRELGMDTYCVCTEDGATHYGGVVSYRVEPTSLQLGLDPRAAEVLGAGGFHIDFDARHFSAVRGGLHRVLGPRATPPEEKARQAFDMMIAGIRLKRAALRERHPNASAEEIEQMLQAWLDGDG